MTRERRYYHTINISDLPEVVRLIEEAKRAKRPIRLMIDEQDGGVLVPPKRTDRSSMARASNLPTATRPRRRSKLLAGFGAVAPTNRPEDWRTVREEVAQAIGREAMGQG